MRPSALGRRARKRRPAWHVSAARAQSIVRGMAAFIVREQAEGRVPTLLNHEGTLRAGLRAELCLQGAPWSTANIVAADLVWQALKTAGAKRPKWIEGQPDFALGVSFTVRTRCQRCGRDLPEERRRFCSGLCLAAYHGQFASLRRAVEGEAYDLAARYGGAR